MSETTALFKGRILLLFLGGLFIGVALPELGLLSAVSPGNDITARLGRQIVWLMIGLGLLAWIRWVERRPLASIGLRRPELGTLGWGVAGAVALIASFVLCYALIFPLLGLKVDLQRTNSIISNAYWLQLVIFVFAAFVEEIIYRGYLIERTEQLTGSKWLAFALSAIVFTLVHLSSWAASQLIVVAFGAVIMGLLYLWKRDLIMVMIAHFLADLVGFALAELQR
jgi:membrane protease YdiL (CAAX protease family)